MLGSMSDSEAQSGTDGAAQSRRPGRRRWRWWAWRLPVAGVAALVVLFVAVGLWVEGLAVGRTYDDVQRIPANDVGVILGVPPRTPEGQRNVIFHQRMDAAAELFHAGKVRILLCSGGNAAAGYDAFADMRRALLARGVPEAAIWGDNAGYRTLDSVVRAGEVFGLRQFTVISQRWHNKRAIALARHHGLKVVGYNADEPPWPSFWRGWLRERLAQVKAALDLYVLDTDPRTIEKGDLVIQPGTTRPSSP